MMPHTAISRNWPIRLVCMEEAPQSDGLISVADAVKEFKTSRATIDRHICNGELKVARVLSGARHFEVSALEQKYKRRSQLRREQQDEIERLRAENHDLRMKAETAEKEHSDSVNELNAQIEGLNTSVGEKGHEITRLKTLLETEQGKLVESDERLRVANGRNTSLQERIDKHRLVEQAVAAMLALKPGNPLTPNGRKIRKVRTDLERYVAMVQQEIDAGGAPSEAAPSET